MCQLDNGIQNCDWRLFVQLCINLHISSETVAFHAVKFNGEATTYAEVPIVYLCYVDMEYVENGT
jgi:hypothetical protein